MNLNFTRPGSEPLPPPLHVILASQSMARKALLEKLGIKFRVAIARIDEEKIVFADPLKTIAKRATSKADEVALHPRVYGLDEKANTIVIAADSMAVLSKKIYGKPADREDAKTMVKALMDHTHELVTAISVIYMEQNVVKKRYDKMQSTKVTIRKMTNPEIDLYCQRYDLSRFAGAYGLNETPWDMITKIDGSFTNVIGLPFEQLLPILKTLKVIQLPESK